jgi:hypothetical protein
MSVSFRLERAKPGNRRLANSDRSGFDSLQEMHVFGPEPVSTLGDMHWFHVDNANLPPRD